MTLNFKREKFTFREQHIKRLVSRGQEKATQRYLAIVRQDARKAIKVKAPTQRDWRTAREGTTSERRRRAKQRIAEKRRLTSQPGQPPIAHIRGSRVGLKLISFAYDRLGDRAIVGYLRYNAAESRHAPRNLEFGGTATITDITTRRRRKRIVHIRPRPNIGPTARRLLPKLRQFMERIA